MPCITRAAGALLLSDEAVIGSRNGTSVESRASEPVIESPDLWTESISNIPQSPGVLDVYLNHVDFEGVREASKFEAEWSLKGH